MQSKLCLMEQELPYGEEKILCSTSSASSVMIGGIFFSRFSLDQSGHRIFNASATYSTSLVCSFKRLLASSKRSANSVMGMISISLLSKTRSSSISSLESFDLSPNSDLCFSTSENNFSGAISSILSEKISDLVFPLASKAAHKTFASTTMSIYFNQGNCFLYCSCIDFEILSPISSASFSVNFDFATIASNNTSLWIFSINASLATADQLIYFCLSISFFNSSGTDTVIVVMVLSSNMTYLLYTQNTVQLYKSFVIKNRMGKLWKTYKRMQ